MNMRMVAVITCWCVFSSISVALADANAIEERDEKRIWPINEKTQKIPKHIDARTGFIDPSVSQLIDAANDKYGPDDRQQIIDFCRHEALIKRTGLMQRPLIERRLRDKSDGLRNELEEEFQYCAVGMIQSWAADEAQDEKDKRR